MSVDIKVKDHSDKSILVTGSDTRKYKELIKSIGGSWNQGLKGWIFRKSDKASVKDLIEKINNGDIDDSMIESIPSENYKKYASLKQYLDLVSRVERLEALIKKTSGEKKGDKKTKTQETEEEDDEEEVMKKNDSDEDEEDVHSTKSLFKKKEKKTNN